MLDVSRYTRDLKVLHFDTECRPLAWYGGDFVTKQPTVISWKFYGDRKAPEVRAIGESDRSSRVLDEEYAMLEAFLPAYEDADVVTGHYIRGFDLTILNGALIRLGLEALGDKLTQDTKNDFSKRHGMSMSQENLGAMFELKHPKVPSNNRLWERANMLLPDGIAWAKGRCVGDVKQHIDLRVAMLEQKLLGAPTMWSSSSSGKSGLYHA